MELLEREAELSHLDEALGGAKRGRGSVVPVALARQVRDASSGVCRGPVPAAA